MPVVLQSLFLGLGSTNSKNIYQAFMRFALIPFLLLIHTLCLLGQKDFFKYYEFTKADTLRGRLRPERTCYDVHFYQLHLKVDIEKQFLSGYVDIHYHTKAEFDRLQIDLWANMQILRIEFEGQDLEYERLHDAVFVQFPTQRKGSSAQFRVYYEGYPRVAPNAPWQGGFVWERDKNGSPWVGVACEEDGASLWWPNKDHLSDEPDSLAISVAVPRGLTCVANGNLRSVQAEEDLDRFNWFVSYPINNYNVTLNIARYAHITDIYEAMDGDQLALDYYVLSYNEDKARRHFQQVHKVLACYEHFFGKYPFWKDGLALGRDPLLRYGTPKCDCLRKQLPARLSGADDSRGYELGLCHRTRARARIFWQ